MTTKLTSSVCRHLVSFPGHVCYIPSSSVLRATRDYRNEAHTCMGIRHSSQMLFKQQGTRNETITLIPLELLAEDKLSKLSVSIRIDQLEDNQHATKTIPFTKTTKGKHIDRVTGRERASGLGYHIFIAHTNLTYTTLLRTVSTSSMSVPQV